MIITTATTAITVSIMSNAYVCGHQPLSILSASGDDGDNDDQ